METLFPNDLGNKQNGHKYVFLEGFFFFVCLLIYFFLGQVKEEKSSMDI